MSKILVNQTASPVLIADTGVTVLASGSYVIPPQDYSLFAASSDVIVLISDVTLILNDGGNDITIVSDAVDIIKGWCPTPPAAVQTPFFFDYSDVVSGNSPVTLISTTVAASTNLFLSRLEITCRIESFIEVKKNGDVVGTLRTGAAQPSARFHWSPNRDCTDGDIIEVVLTKRAGTSDISVGAHLMGVTTTI